ncbi:DUF5313 family protein [Antrihabitans sp. YC2-6]|uniref:DUF5313 family protein n=1 Tax=Antrihabitans sp. YC2-6 TaxID=2799498 RepID=UPI0018F5A02C|nr:DUF5313 family protein [Antrihabitans sp. YC2-6]MBJ8345887.1 DUF5313 family protein [Antrihabitans sp. YC2-6]
MSKRPNPIQWLGYAWGRKLPDEMRDWVRNDLTGRFAITKHLVRGMVPFAPIFVVFMLFPGPLALRGAMTLLALLLALFYCGAYRNQNRAHRLALHGLPVDLEDATTTARRASERAVYEAQHPRQQAA